MSKFRNCRSRGNSVGYAGMFKKLMALAGAMLALVGLSGCLEMESVIALKKDGSGTMTETVSIGAQMAGMMQMGGGGEGAEDPFADFGEDAAKEKAKTYGEGVEFVSTKKEEKDGGLTFTTVYKFADINTVVYEPGQMMNNSEEEEEETEEEPVKMFSYKDGVLTIEVPDPSQEDFAMGDEEMGEEEMAMMAPMMAGMKVTAKLVVEGGIAETNATFRDGDAITLMAMNFDELLKNEGGLGAMKKLDVEDRAAFAKAVSELKGFDMESKEKVSVKLK